jgi:hypothetical protein
MSIWLRILNYSLKLSLESYQGFSFKTCQMGAFLQLACLSVDLIWDTRGLSKAVASHVR